MKPIDFPQSSKVLQRPENMLDTDCKPLPIWSDGTECVSCWKPTWKERLRILIHGKVWLGVLSGRTQPPVFITGDDVFPQPPFHARVRFFIEDVCDDIRFVAKAVENAYDDGGKAKKFLYGFVVAFLIGVIVPMFGFAMGCLSGVARQFWESRGAATVETMDIFFAFFGSLLALPFAWLVNYLIF